MGIVSKSELAAHLRISRARVSQYVKRGLPVRDDGRVDLSAGLNWIRRNIEPDADGGGAAVVASALRNQDGGGHQNPVNPVDAASNIALGCLFSFVPGIAAAAAREAGVSDDVAEKIFASAYAKAITAGEMVASKFMGVEPRSVWPSLEACKQYGVVDR